MSVPLLSRGAAAVAAALLIGGVAFGAADAKKPPRLSTSSVTAPGEDLFNAHCGICHLQMGTGTLMLDRRLGADHALLADRTDLDPNYVKYVVRNGLNSMPPQTRVDLTDSDLDRVIAFLTRPASERAPPQGPPGQSRK